MKRDFALKKIELMRNQRERGAAEIALLPDCRAGYLRIGLPRASYFGLVPYNEWRPKKGILTRPIGRAKCEYGISQSLH